MRKEVIESSGTIQLKTILLADDDEFVRDIHKTVILMEGYAVIDAFDGEDAILKYQLYRESINLLILDIIMPKRSGFEAYEAIAKIDPNVKAIFISGYTNDYQRRQDIINKGLVLISKPFSPTELMKHVNAVFQANLIATNSCDVVTS